MDEWGRGFVAETDYRYEAANTEAFSAAMERRGLGAVTSPSVVRELSTSCLLTTEWVDGTRLDLDASPDVPRLCGVAINAYLTMLLDTGVLHCDPHPGNLLRTTEGALCIRTCTTLTHTHTHTLTLTLTLPLPLARQAVHPRLGHDPRRAAGPAVLAHRVHRARSRRGL